MPTPGDSFDRQDAPMSLIIPPQALQAGIERLLAAPRDLESARPADCRVLPHGRGTPAHEALFDAYRSALREIVPEVRRIWVAIVDRCGATVNDPKKAMLEAFRFQPAGAAFDGRFIAVIREHWLSCDSVNSGLPLEQRVAPECLLLRWLVERHETQALEVVAGMPYWPIGMDDAGRWV
jgi:hypothetical protein